MTSTSTSARHFRSEARYVLYETLFLQQRVDNDLGFPWYLYVLYRRSVGYHIRYGKEVTGAPTGSRR